MCPVRTVTHVSGRSIKNLGPLIEAALIVVSVLCPCLFFGSAKQRGVEDPIKLKLAAGISQTTGWNCPTSSGHDQQFFLSQNQQAARIQSEGTGPR